MGWLDALRRPRAEDPRAAGQWPPRSDVAVAAWRNLDGQPGAESLLRLLAQLDERINKGIHAARG